MYKQLESSTQLVTAPFLTLIAPCPGTHAPDPLTLVLLQGVQQPSLVRLQVAVLVRHHTTPQG